MTQVLVNNGTGVIFLRTVLETSDPAFLQTFWCTIYVVDFIDRHALVRVVQDLVIQGLRGFVWVENCISG